MVEERDGESWGKRWSVSAYLGVISGMSIFMLHINRLKSHDANQPLIKKANHGISLVFPKRIKMKFIRIFVSLQTNNL